MACSVVGDDKMANYDNNNVFNSGFDSDSDFSDDFGGDGSKSGGREDDGLEGGRKR